MKKPRSGPARDVRAIGAKKLVDEYIYRIDLDADYQREKIWPREAQELLIDSIHLNIDIPKLYLAQTAKKENFEFECIDGKQRMTALMNFFKPEPTSGAALTLRVGGERYTYRRLKAELPQIAKKIEDFELTFVIYPELEDDFLRDLFRRLQLGTRLNSGEILNAHVGAIRDFVYKEMGPNAPFLRNTHLSVKRFSRQFALAQICLNSFARAVDGEFRRARLDDLEDFFKERYDLDRKDANLVRIRGILSLLDSGFGEKASAISSRAVAVSGYLFVESLHVNGMGNLVADFADFYVALLSEVKTSLRQVSRFSRPKNRKVLEGFQKYVSQASVEPYAIRGRQRFLESAFDYYRAPETRGGIVGGEGE